jgi:hypothetical protein
MNTTRMGLIAALLFDVALAHAQALAGHVGDPIVACESNDEFSGYAYLVSTKNIIGATIYLLGHHCQWLMPGTPIHLENSSAARDTDHVCVTPLGYTECVWTFASHIKLD